MIHFLRKNAVLAAVLTTTLAHTVMAFAPSTPAFASASKRSLSSSTLVTQKMAGAELSEFSDYTENNKNFNWNEYSKKRRSTSYEVPGKSPNNKDNKNNEKKKNEASELNSLQSTEKMDSQSSSLSSSKEQAQKSENNNNKKTMKKNTKKAVISSTTPRTQAQPRPPGVNVDYMRLSKSQSNARPYPKQKQKLSDPNDLDYMRKGFEMRWQLMGSLDECKLEEDMHSCGGECDMCHGAGTLDCRFCNGTGFSMLSDGTMLSQGKPCLVCSGVGEEPCKGCGGSGWVANWRGLAP